MNTESKKSAKSKKPLLHEGLLNIIQEDQDIFGDLKPFINEITVLLMACHLLKKNEIPSESHQNFAKNLFDKALQRGTSRNLHPMMAQEIAETITAINMKDYFLKLLKESKDSRVENIKNIRGYLK